MHLARHIGQVIVPAVGDDDLATRLEVLQVVRYLAAEEVLSVQRGLLDHHGHALGLHALHDTLNRARSEVVRASS